MISFFRVSTIYKYLLLFLVFLVIRIPAILYGIPLSNDELSWMLIGERMGVGFLLYTEIWDDISPAAATIYWLIDLIFGKSPTVYHFLSAALLFIQALMLNDIFRRREVYDDLTQIPAFLYIVFTSLFMDFYTLSPILMANTALIWVANLTFFQINEKNRGNSFLEIGIFLGVATLFYLPSFIFAAVPIIIFLIYTGSKLQDYIAIFSGFLFVIGLSFLVFYLNSQEYDFYINYIFTIGYLNPNPLINLLYLLILFTFPTVLSFLAFSAVLGYNRYTNYQNRSQNVMILWIFAGLISILFTSRVAPVSFLLAIPGVVFLLSHYFLIKRGSFLKELLFSLFFASVLFFNYDSLYNLRKYYDKSLGSLIEIDEMLANPHPKADLLKKKNILILGNDLGAYQYGKLATPYLNWRIAQRHFDNLNNYNILKSIYENFEADPPEVIVDESKVAKKLFDVLPLLAQKYEPIPNTNLYILKK